MKATHLYSKARLLWSLILLFGVIPIAGALPKSPDFPDLPDPPSDSPETPPIRKADLTAYQSPVKYQGGRDTCGTFATTAALEAAYKRHFNIDLDLSEQYLNHWAQLMLPLGKSLPLSEINSAALGGGGMIRPFAALQKGFGLPIENVLPYLPDAGYQNDDVGDLPAINNWGIDHLQRDIDDFNLAENQADYIFQPPNINTTTIMPLAALQQAKYRPASLMYASNQDLSNLEWYRNQLDQKREIVIEMRCCDGQPGFNSGNENWNLPVNSDGTLSNGGGFGHVLLVVGYDDSRKMFRVKNSWGNSWGKNGYAWLSYDFVTNRVITIAGVIQDVINPQSQFDVWNNKQLYLGRWNLDVDGEQNILDIYNIPDNDQGNNHRIGTLFKPNGTIQRVNGRISGNRLEFWYDSTNPNQMASDTTALFDKTNPSTNYYTTYLFSWDHKSMAGNLHVNGQNIGVQAVKGAFPLIGSANSGALGLSSYLGTWNLNFDGWRGTLAINAIDINGEITGNYTDSSGNIYTVNGNVSSDIMSFKFVINFPTPQKFTGLINTNQLGVISGTTIWQNIPFGFYASRLTGDIAFDPPVNTPDPEPISPVCVNKPYLPNC